MERAIRCVEVAMGNQKSHHSTYSLVTRYCTQRDGRLKIDKKYIFPLGYPSDARNFSLRNNIVLLDELHVNDALFFGTAWRDAPPI